jgi:hypothetical protein
MKAEDVRAFSDDQLQDELLKLKKEQFNLRFQAGHRPAGKHCALYEDPPGYRPGQNGSASPRA